MVFHAVYRKLERMWEKNAPELKAALRGELRTFLLSNSKYPKIPRVPVFVFHSVEAGRFEAQLRYLADNGYQTLDGERLLKLVQGQYYPQDRQVVLTFDDATGSAWAVAYPLLKKYGYQAILFVIPGLVPEDDQTYPNLDDVWKGRATLDAIANRESEQPLCTWQEIRMMHDSRVMDIQSHSYTHARVNISSRVVDFIHPGFDTYLYENVNLPLRVDEPDRRPLRKLLLGQPVYQSMSRMSGELRYLEDRILNTEMVAYVSKNGGKAFFARKDWRKQLQKHYNRLRTQANTGRYETIDEMEAALVGEFTRSKQELEKRLPGKVVTQFCYPWFQGSTYSDRISAQCGYQMVYYGLDSLPDDMPAQERPVRIRRISEEYLFCLPGSGKRSLANVWAQKVAGARIR